MANDPYIKLAKKTISQFVRTGKISPFPDDLPEEMLSGKAGVFVSLHNKDGSLRGCIGTFLPTQKNIAKEIIENAIAAAAQDPRFMPVTETELPNLVYSVDILSEPRPANRQQIDPEKYGLIVSSVDGRKGLLLPDIPGVESAEQQIEICHQKAGIGPFEPVQFEIFIVERHENKEV